MINVNAEGTKELMPTSSNFGNLQVYDMKRPFAAYYNTDPNHRLYFHISNIGEKAYFGFRHIVQTGINNSTTQFRIKDSSGNVVYVSTNIPTTSTSTGYIGSYAAAVAGPKIGGIPVNGYKPFSFTPVTTGDFYMEFNTDTSKGTYHIDYFDLTVVNSSNQPIPGRLWSYAWDISTRSFSNGFNASMYIYTDDAFVSKINFNGIEAFGFVIACNSTGPGDLEGGNNENRISIEGNSTRPQFKIFLNDPDINAYPSGIIPAVIQNLTLIGTPVYGQPVLFTVNISQPGIVQIVLDINDSIGYQPNSEDVILVEPVHAGIDTIIWDEKDGFGNYVSGNTNVLLSSSFASGTTHLPLYDPETHPNGYIVNRIRPATGLCDLYWDDSNFSGGTVNIDGSIKTGHSWPYFFGDVRTMNTWWNGYTLPILNSFGFSIGNTLPIDLLEFTATVKDKQIELEWATASETNCQYFVVEREKASDKSYEEVLKTNGSGNSNNILRYVAYDYSPILGPAFYRLKQIDFDGKFTYSDPVYVNFNFDKLSYAIYPNPVNSNNAEISIVQAENSITEIVVYNEKGQEVYSRSYCSKDNCVLKLNFDSIENGIYILHVKSGDKEFKTKIIKED